jgi:hypothetical protein
MLRMKLLPPLSMLVVGALLCDAPMQGNFGRALQQKSRKQPHAK